MANGAKKNIENMKVILPKDNYNGDKRKYFEKMIEQIMLKRYQNLQSKLHGVWGIPG